MPIVVFESGEASEYLAAVIGSDARYPAILHLTLEYLQHVLQDLLVSDIVVSNIIYKISNVSDATICKFVIDHMVVYYGYIEDYWVFFKAGHEVVDLVQCQHIHLEVFDYFLRPVMASTLK